MTDKPINWKEVKIKTVTLSDNETYFSIGSTPIHQRKIANLSWIEGGIVATDENDKPLVFINDAAISLVYYE